MTDQRLPGDKPKGSGKPSRINRLLVAQAAKDYSAQTNLVMVSNLGMSGEQTTELRSSLRSQGLKMRVVRSLLTIRAFKEMGIEEAEKMFSGPTAIIDAEDPVAAAKVALQFCSKFDNKLQVVGGLVEGQVLDAKQIKELAKSKSRKELLADISGQAIGPGGRLVAAIKGPGSKLAGQVKALIEKLEEAETGAAPAQA
jgi:large subunit ribosomal protein L10